MPGETVALSELRIERLSANHVPELFDCGVGDLNDFLKDDALNYQDQLLAVTHVCLYKDRLVGYYSLMNDSIGLSEKEKELFKRLGKGLRSYPAVKICRLAVDKGYQRQGIGEFLLGDVFRGALSDGNRSACRLVTVDSYLDRREYYLKHCFVENAEQDSNQDTVSLRMDLYNWHERMAIAD